MDAVSQTILDVAWSRTSEPALNIVHPRPTSWNVILDSINDAIVAEGLAPKKLPFVNFSTWVAQLEEHAADSSPEALTIVSSGCRTVHFGRLTVTVCLFFPRSRGSSSWTSSATCQRWTPRYSKKMERVRKQGASRCSRHARCRA